jgi:hypothetical protein
VTAFHQVGVLVHVPQCKVLDHLAVDPELALLGPFGNEDAGMDIVRVRQAMLIPFQYVRLLLQCPLTPREAWVPFRYVRLLLQCPLTPREAWVQVAGAIYNDGNQDTCGPLLDWFWNNPRGFSNIRAYR